MQSPFAQLQEILYKNFTRIFNLEQNLKSQVRFLPIQTQLKDLCNIQLRVFEGSLMRLDWEEVGKGI